MHGGINLDSESASIIQQPWAREQEVAVWEAQVLRKEEEWEIDTMLEDIDQHM